MLTCSTSTDSSTSSSSSPFSRLPNNNNNKSMEEVWKDINITSLPNTPLPHNNHYNNNNNTYNNHRHHHNNNNNNNSNNNNHIIHHPTPTTNFRGMILQDFLNCNNPSIRAVDSPPIYHHHHHDHQQQEDDDDHHHHAPTTALKLTNDFHQIFEPNYSAFGTFDVLASSSVLTSFVGGGSGGDATAAKKRSSESTPENATVDRRNKRMIKNRESAARSRARKQAYITELELEVAHLAAENTRLRKQHQQLLEAPSTQQPKKKGLHRTLTAPF